DHPGLRRPDRARLLLGPLLDPAPALPRRDRSVSARARPRARPRLRLRALLALLRGGAPRPRDRGARSERQAHRDSAGHRGAGAGLVPGNVHYGVGDAMDCRGGRAFDAAYMLDIVHHIGEEAVRPLLEQVGKCLPAGGRLVIKDVDRAPAWKRWFTLALDKVMDPRTAGRYWAGRG